MWLYICQVSYVIIKSLKDGSTQAQLLASSLHVAIQVIIMLHKTLLPRLHDPSELATSDHESYIHLAEGEEMHVSRYDYLVLYAT